MANPFRDTENKAKPNMKPADNNTQKVTKNEKNTNNIEKKEPKNINYLEGIGVEKPKAKSCSFYLDEDVANELEKLAKANKSSKSKVLNTLLRNILIN